MECKDNKVYKAHRVPKDNQIDPQDVKDLLAGILILLMLLFDTVVNEYFDLLKGEEGPQGVAGPQGPQGPQGDTCVYQMLMG